MPLHFLLEIAVQSVPSARAAERGGANRIELCANLDCGGTTPSVETQRKARAAIQIPIHILVRPRGGNFVYSSAEIGQMKQQIETAKRIGMNGVVFGILMPDQTIDVQRTRELIAVANPLPVTFHRAFDETIHPKQALEDAIATGASRILTSSGESSAIRGAARLKELTELAGNRIALMPGGGLHAGNLLDLLQIVPAKEIHSGLGAILPYGSADFASFESEVRKLVRLSAPAASET